MNTALYVITNTKYKYFNKNNIFWKEHNINMNACLLPMLYVNFANDLLFVHHPSCVILSYMLQPNDGWSYLMVNSQSNNRVYGDAMSPSA